MSDAANTGAAPKKKMNLYWIHIAIGVVVSSALCFQPLTQLPPWV